MISINIGKYVDLATIVIISFAAALGANHYFGLELQWGLLAGLILTCWSSLYELISNLQFNVSFNEDGSIEYDDDVMIIDEDEKTK